MEVEALKDEIKLIDLKQEQMAIERKKLVRDLFYKEFVEVEWDVAEKYFIENLDSTISWSAGPTVKDDSEFYRSTSLCIHENEDGSKEMWLGGYRNKDCFPRGKSFFVERRYANEISNVQED